MNKLIFLISALFYVNLSAQGVTLGNNAAPDPSAGLDLQFTDRGFLPPRLNTVQRNAITSPAFGLSIYNTDSDCIEVYFQSGGWRQTNCGCQSFPNAGFTPLNAVRNIPITFTPNSTGQSAYQWTFQNANLSTSSNENPTVTWDSVGTYQVTLGVTDSEGCVGNDTAQITVISCIPTTYQFTNCGTIGRNGPIQSSCNSAYSGSSLNGLVTVSGGIQNWTVPQTGTYRIEVAGAKGGSTHSSFPGGQGAILRGDIFLTAGQTLKIMVGNEGGRGTTGSWGHGGGGGTYVTLSDNTPLIIAGGGGGASPSRNVAGLNGTTSTCGSAGTNGGNGGCNGNGGNSGPTNNTGQGGGGGGLLTNGQNWTTTGAGGGGMAFVNGGVAGNTVGASTELYQEGGFGGGGGGTGYTPDGGGGGGGYSGGGGGAT